MDKEKQGTVFIGLTFDDSITHRQWLENTKKHIEQLNLIIEKHQGE